MKVSDENREILLMNNINASSYKSETQEKNLAWFLPRPKPDKYKGGMPLYCEKWLLELAADILEKPFDDLKVLNIFCGMNQYGTRVDIKEEVEPDFVLDAHNLTEQFRLEDEFDVILADPPYSNDEAKELYGTPPLKYKTWTDQCMQILEPGKLLIVYHKYVMPNPNPEYFFIKKRVFIGSRTYHVPRVALYFERKEGDDL